ncbi:MAG: hypothetical protein HY334_08565 [Armatimonadetes bacterium]|nr:hypothetical protein [Armatimonadota bacterium]
MAKWKKQIYKLPKGHGWRAKPGNKIFVANRGDVRFDFPADWVPGDSDDAVEFLDREPPDDNCRLKVSVIRLPSGVNTSALPLTDLLEQAVKDDHRQAFARKETVHVRRPDLELAWTEIRFIDPIERREACGRLCLAHGSGIVTYITMDFWLDDRDRFGPVWDEVLGSLQLGVYVADPTRHYLQ